MKAILQEVHPVLAAKDVSASVDFYRRLGFTLRFQDTPSEPRYAVVQRDGVELHIQWASAVQWDHPVDRPTYRFIVSALDALYDEFGQSGEIPSAGDHVSPWAKPGDTPWGTREFHVRDPGLNGLQFYQPL
jgi:catechol 2,3-dioxygenase-like lactoylglutathione lyase family enzyme